MDDNNSTIPAADQYYLSLAQFDQLLTLLAQLGYTVIGPTVADGAITYAEINSSADLPRGMREEQEAGRYRLVPTGNQRLFDFNVGPHSCKQFLFPPRVTVSSCERTEQGWQFATPPAESTKLALLGVRACDLAAIAVQDRVFMSGPYIDPLYQARRDNALIIAVNCATAAPTCFCTSMGTGPECERGFDLALTEIETGFVLAIGSPRGHSIAEQLRLSPATTSMQAAAAGHRQQARQQVTRQLEPQGLRDLLLQNLDHPQWDDVATRCLSCTNCTMVCPTCFCSTVTDVTDLTGDKVTRERQWDSCFNMDLSYTASGTVRDDRRSRYRQWLTHKLASWHDQFDVSGCVGCGRCITWCPVGIDLTQEVAAIRNTPNSKRLLPVTQLPAAKACAVPKETSP